MKRHLFGLIAFVSFGLLVLTAMKHGSDPGLQVAASIKSAAPTQNAGQLKVDMDFGKMPLYFIANQGQMDGRVAYSVQGKDKTLYFTQEGLTIALNGPRKTGEDLLRIDSKSKGIEHLPVKDEKGQRRELHNGDSSAKSYIERWVVKLDFVGPNRDVKLVGLEKTEALISYFRGKPGDWKTGLSTYSKIVYPDLWPGIDLAYYGNINQLKYEFIVHPGADPSQIQLAYRGITGVSVTEDGRLEIMTPLGSFHDGVPIAYQEVGGKKVDVALAYNLEELGKESTVDDPRGPARENCPYNYGFKVGPYDRTIPLFLDPMILIYCGYIGGSNDDYGLNMAIGGSGNAYVTGYTFSDQSSFPTIAGPDLTHNGSDDAFVVKVNAAGTGLVYCGFIGGSNDDIGVAIAVDSSGNAYVAGLTASNESSFPVTVGPGLTYNGGDWDAFVAKVNAAGTELTYCGYIGGLSVDWANRIAVDSSGNAYVSGDTSSDQSSFPVTVGPDLTQNGSHDAFVVKINAAGTGLTYCGYIGGLNEDWANGIAVDSSGNAYVAGKTSSDQTSFPVAVGPDLTYNGGDWDAFVAKVNAAGTGLNYCGYIGGSGDDYGYGVALDSLGNAYVVGTTYSDQGSFPVTVGPDLTFNGIVDGFVAKIAAFSKDDLLGTWSTQGVYFRNSDTGAWTKLGSAATMITAGDLDGDGVDDLIGIWPTQGGVWIKYSKTSAWSKLSSTADWIAVGDMNGDGRCDLLGTWAGQGVYYRNSISGVWVKMSTPATKITAGDLDGDWIDDLIGIWPTQGGVWVKYSKTGGWSNLSSTADWIGAGDMNGDGRADFLGTWAGQGVYYRNSVGGAWVKMSSPATQIVAGQIDDDLCDDLLGMWPSQGGVWVKYSKTSGWSKLSSTADWISAGKMRLLGMLGGIFEPAAPVGGFALGPSYQGTFEDLSEQGPLGVEFRPVEQRNTVVGMALDKVKQRERRPGPGEPGFACVVERNLMPQEDLDKEQPKQRGFRPTRRNRR